MDTLCGQAFGAQNYPKIGIIAQRAFLITLLLSVPLMLAWSHIQAPLVFLGQSASIVGIAVPYLLWISPQLPLGAINVVLEKFQMSQVRGALVRAAAIRSGSGGLVRVRPRTVLGSTVSRDSDAASMWRWPMLWDLRVPLRCRTSWRPSAS